MKSIALIFILTLISLHSFGQIIFQKGYFINNQEIKTECLIKNLDWQKNPQSFKYKLSENEPELEGKLNDIKEFGIPGFLKFIKIDINIDMTSDNLRKVTNEKNPIWEQKLIFLRVLRTGEINLYSYIDKENTRFFYSLKDGEIKQLVYKRYLLGSNLVQNFTFKQQLLNDLDPEKINKQRILDLKYNNSDLEKFVDAYNELFETPVEKIQGKIKRKVFEIKLTPGVSYSDFVLVSGQNKYRYDFSPEYRMGCEIAAILPFNMNKWSLYIEPTFYMNKLKKVDDSNLYFSDFNFKMISFPVGIKGKSFLKNKSAIFYNANIDFGIGSSFDSKVDYFKIEQGSNFALGAGFEKKKISLECRYISKTNFLNGSYYYETEYQRVQLIFGYKIFGK